MLCDVEVIYVSLNFCSCREEPKVGQFCSPVAAEATKGKWHRRDRRGVVGVATRGQEELPVPVDIRR